MTANDVTSRSMRNQRSCSVPDGHERRFDLRAMRFFPRRQLQIAAKARHLLVCRESRRQRRDLEQHVARFAEVDGFEVAAIADLGHLAAEADELLAKLQLF